MTDGPIDYVAPLFVFAIGSKSWQIHIFVNLP